VRKSQRTIFIVYNLKTKTDVLNADDKLSSQAVEDSQTALIPQLAMLWQVNMNIMFF
jgi:hypothetical protein